MAHKTLLAAIVAAIVTIVTPAAARDSWAVVIEPGGIGFMYHRPAGGNYHQRVYGPPPPYYGGYRVPRRQAPIRDAYGRPYVPGDWGNRQGGYLQDAYGRPYVPGTW